MSPVSTNCLMRRVVRACVRARVCVCVYVCICVCVSGKKGAPCCLATPHCASELDGISDVTPLQNQFVSPLLHLLVSSCFLPELSSLLCSSKVLARNLCSRSTFLQSDVRIYMYVCVCIYTSCEVLAREVARVQSKLGNFASINCAPVVHFHLRVHTW